MDPNPTKAALQRGETVTMLWSHTASPDLAEAAVRIGWRTILIDNEHGVADLNQAVAVHRAVLSAGGDVVLRVPANDPVYFKRALDRGFRSLMVPMVNSADDARALVAACRYPPRGVRGYAAPIVRGSGYGTFSNYAARAHEETLLIAQIEHADAAKRISEIAGVDGIDALFLGPNDLAGSMGLLERLDDPSAMAVYEGIERDVLSAGKWLGEIPRPGRTAAELHALGCKLIAGPSDIGLFLAGARASLAEYSF